MSIEKNKNIGYITQVIGPVIDAVFSSGVLPKIYNALLIEVEGKDGPIICEVQQLLGDNRVRAISMSATDGLQRGVKVYDTKAPISVPVGKTTLGRIFNVLGQPIDNLGDTSRNPEGQLRPQLLDRFGMHAEMRTVKDPDLRVKIVEERTLFDLDPQSWVHKYKDQQALLKQRIIDAQNLLDKTELSYDFRVKISKVCSELNVDGLRGDIVTNRAAKAYAAFQGKKDVVIEDIEKIIILCLRHRLRKDPLETIDSSYSINNLGEHGTIIKAKPGYIRNYLIPKKFAKVATHNVIHQFELEQKAIDMKKKQFLKECNDNKELLENLGKFTIYKKIKEDGVFFGKITKKQILDL